MAKSLIENLTEEWDPDAFQDEYREALMELINKKAGGEEVTMPPIPETPQVVDLMAALKASVDASKKKRGSRNGKERDEASGDGAEAAKPRSRKKAAAG